MFVVLGLVILHSSSLFLRSGNVDVTTTTAFEYHWMRQSMHGNMSILVGIVS